MGRVSSAYFQESVAVFLEERASERGCRLLEARRAERANKSCSLYQPVLIFDGIL